MYNYVYIYEYTVYTHIHTCMYTCVCVRLNEWIQHIWTPDSNYLHLFSMAELAENLKTGPTVTLPTDWEKELYKLYMIWYDMTWYDMIWLYSNCKSFCQSVSVMIASIFFPTTWPGSRLDKKLCHALDPSQCVIVCAEWQLGFQRSWADLPLEASHHLRKPQLVLIRSWMSDVRNAISSLRTW
jgi:hypothetical protein